MKIERFLPHFVTVALLVMSAVFHDPAYAFAAMVSVLGILAHNVVQDRIAALTPKAGTVDEAAKRAMQDLNARVATLEYGVKTRGF